MKSMSLVLKAAVLVGLFEGLHIAHYQVFVSDWSSHDPLDALATVVWVAGVHVFIWAAFGALLRPIFREPFSLLQAVFSVWLVVAFLARWMLQDRTGPAAHALLLIAGALLLLTPRSWRERLAAPYRGLLTGVALLTVSTYSLWGRVPDFRYPLGSQFWFYFTSAIVAIVVFQAMTHWPRVTAGALVACWLSAALWNGWWGSSSSDKPNVVWILIDTTRRDHIEPFGDLVQTPAIKRLAAEGVRFDDAVTVIPKTAQSVASFFTGRYPIHHGVRALADHLSESQPNVVTLFKESGYRTVALVNNPWLSKERGFGLGFDRFHGTFEMLGNYGGGFRYVTWLVLIDQLTQKRIEPRRQTTQAGRLARASTVTDSAIRYLGISGQEPFFLYVHYFQPHWPYVPPPHLERRYNAPPGETSLVNSIGETDIEHGQMVFHNPLPEKENEGARRLYRGELDETMSEVGRLLNALEKGGLRDNTIVVFTADHGHALGEHDYYFHHGAFLYEASIRIPLIVRWPGELPEGRVVEHQVRSIDVAPTLLEMAGIGVKDSMDGRSLSGYWTDTEDRPRNVFLESDVKMMEDNTRRRYPGVVGKLRAVRNGRFKLILTPEVDGAGFELFDLVADPDETRNLAAEKSHRETFSTLLEQLTALIPEKERRALEEIDDSSAPGQILNETINERDLELLRSLGYVR